MNCRPNWIVVCLHLLIAVQPDSLEAGIWPLTLLQNVKPSTNIDVDQATPIATTIAHRFAGYIEYQPNGTIVLRSNSLQNDDTNLQNLVLFRAILKAIKFAAPYAKIDVGTEAVSSDGGAGDFNIKIYGDGVEHKFPPFLERFIQRIQTYFSVYRYTDTSRPVRQQTTTANYGTATDPFTAIDGGNYLTSTYSSTGSGDGGIGGETTTFVDTDTAGYGTTEDYNEFISIDEEDGYISVGED